MRFRFPFAVAAASLGLATAAHAAVTVPVIIGEHMVLQQGQPVPIWGTAAPGEKVTVRFAGQEQTTVAGANGQWKIQLRRLKASSQPRALTITGADTAHPLTYNDVLVGEVWVCSGQSNMAWGVSGSNNAAQEIAGATFPAIRLFTVGGNVAPVPLRDCSGAWAVCSPATVGGFSAVGYYFGRELHHDRQVPIGLINTSWGGTVAEAWTSGPALRARLPEFIPALDQLGSESGEAAKARYQQTMAEYNGAREKLYALEADLAAAAGRAQPDLNDIGWKTMSAPGAWEGQGLPGLDGMVWFRKTIDLPAAWAGKDLVLRPGPIDEVDVTWFNGEQVGSRGNIRNHDVQFWNVPRDYRVPGRLVNAGRNVVAIRVIDAMGAGGLAGASANEMYAAPVDDAAAPHVSLAGEWRYDVELALPTMPVQPNNPNQPSVLFNGMVNPLVPFGIRGAIWYQGESNADRPDQYRRLLPALIGDWRAHWQSDFPFLVVQLANYMARSDAPQESSWAALREAQALTARRTPKVGLALAIDIGEAGDIHPRNKQDVGKRLALAARKIAYGEHIEESGPVFDKMSVKNGQAILKFRHTGGGLVTQGDKLVGFSICGADGKYVFADARIDGNQVVVSSSAVPNPVRVRYAWADNPAATLYNGAGLPAVPFRTDAPTN